MIGPHLHSSFYSWDDCPLPIVFEIFSVIGPKYAILAVPHKLWKGSINNLDRKCLSDQFMHSLHSYQQMNNTVSVQLTSLVRTISKGKANLRPTQSVSFTIGTGPARGTKEETGVVLESFLPGC